MSTATLTPADADTLATAERWIGYWTELGNPERVARWESVRTWLLDCIAAGV